MGLGRHVVLIAAVALVARSTATPPTPVPSSVPAPAASDNLPRTDPPASTPAPEPSAPTEPSLDTVSGRELVERALEDGRIDHLTSLLYRVRELFDDPRLPAEYRGEGIDQDSEVFMEIELGDVALSQAIQEARRVGATIRFPRRQAQLAVMASAHWESKCAPNHD